MSGDAPPATAGHPVHRRPEDVPVGGGSSAYPPAMRAAYEVREVVGPGGGGHGAGLTDDSVRAGTIRLPAGFHYPAHRHPAAELYVVVAGELDWEVDGHHFRAGPGSFVNHRPGAVHAMTVVGAHDAELLWVWHPASGDPDGVLGIDAEPVGDWSGWSPGYRPA